MCGLTHFLDGNCYLFVNNNSVGFVDILGEAKVAITVVLFLGWLYDMACKDQWAREATNCANAAAKAEAACTKCEKFVPESKRIGCGRFANSAICGGSCVPDV
jgi:hypothetical protein